MNILRKLWLFVFLLLPSALLYAQEIIEGNSAAAIPNAGHYVVAIIAGFVLA